MLSSLKRATLAHKPPKITIFFVSFPPLRRSVVPLPSFGSFGSDFRGAALPNLLTYLLTSSSSYIFFSSVGIQFCFAGCAFLEGRERTLVSRALDMATFNEENRAAPTREEASFQSKYGGISPKKPLISKDHERAYFDSADWVLGKQGASNNSTTAPAAEPLKPKLQRTAYHQLPPRRPACTSGGTE